MSKKTRLSKTLSRVKVLKNGGQHVVSQCGRVKVFENARVISDLILAPESEILLPFSWSSADGRKRYVETLVWIQIFLCVFDKLKTEVLENALHVVWTRPKIERKKFNGFKGT